MVFRKKGFFSKKKFNWSDRLIVSTNDKKLKKLKNNENDEKNKNRSQKF